jgi:hypothetical protein
MNAPRPKTKSRVQAKPSKQRKTGPRKPAAPAQPPVGLDSAKHAAIQNAQNDAVRIRLGYLPACLASAFNTCGSFNAASFRYYLDDLLEQSGNPTDPAERILIEHLGMVHLRAADMHAQAAQAKSVELVTALNGASARLSSEVRQIALTLKELRSRATAAPKLRLAKVG